MINANMRLYDYFTLGAKDAYYYFRNMRVIE